MRRLPSGLLAQRRPQGRRPHRRSPPNGQRKSASLKRPQPDRPRPPLRLCQQARPRQPPRPSRADTPVPIAYLPAPPAVSPASDGIYDYSAVTTGRAHTCLLRNDGVVLCTGTVDRETPFPCAEPSPWSPSASGANHACGIGSDGSVACWGSNDWDPWYGHTTGQADPPEGAFYLGQRGRGSHLRDQGGRRRWYLLGRSTSSEQADPPEGDLCLRKRRRGCTHLRGQNPDDSLTCWGNDEFGQASPPTGEFLSVSSGTWLTVAG